MFKRHVFFSPEGETGQLGQPGGSPAPPTSGTDGRSSDDLQYWQQQAREAFKARDEVRARMRDLETRALSDDDRKLFDTLRQQQAQAEEERKRKDGEWSKLKEELMTAHQAKLQELQTSLQSVQDELTESDLLHAFYGATVGEHNLFGEQGLTILTPEIAMPYFRSHVEVVRENGKRQLVVKQPNGSIIRGDDGEPAPFPIAMRKLIQQMPNKDRILRGSGRSGSGSAGGAGSVEPEDLKTVIQKARQGDKEALSTLKDHQRASGGLTSGRYWERRRGA